MFVYTLKTTIMNLTPDKNGIVDGQLLINALVGNKIPKVKQTKKYSIFKLDAIEVSRLIHKRIDLLEQSMKENGWNKYSVVVVDKNFNVVDGNYRVIAAIRASVPINYVTTSEAPYPGKPWTKKDWMYGIDHLNEEITRLKEQIKLLSSKQ